MRWRGAIAVFLSCWGAAGAAEAWFEQLEQKLTLATPGAMVRARLSGVLSLEAYALSEPPTGLVFTDDRHLLVPRLVVFGDAQIGRQWSGFAQVRADTGFDPSDDGRRVRLDEYALRYRLPWPGHWSVQAGQFATVIGNFVGRHDARDNPFVTAPLPYEAITPVSDTEPPASVATFVAADPAERYERVPMIWGPSYATGVSLFGRMGRVDLAAEVKNTSPSSRPESWAITRTGFEAPTYSARLGFRPDLRWNFGLSVSDGAYLAADAEPHLSGGKTRRDFRQRLIAGDGRFAWRHLQVWGELFRSTFDVPRIGNVATTAAYLETKYKLTPQLYGAVRVNRQVFSTLVSASSSARWSPNLSRVEIAAGYRFTAHLDVKAQVGGERASGRSETAVSSALQLNVRF